MIPPRTRLQEINAELGVLHLKTVALEEEKQIEYDYQVKRRGKYIL
jgi:hypothetical protein